MQQTDAFISVVAVAELREGFLASYEVEGREIVVARTAGGVYVYDATCPHADFRFSSARLKGGCEVECQMHGARFKADETGEVVKGPAQEPLWVLESRIVDGMLEVLFDW